MARAKSPKQYMGVRAILPPDLVTTTRAPTSSDTAYVKGTLWLDTVLQDAFMWPGSGSWISLGTTSSGDITSLTPSSGSVVTPVAGNVDLTGTANQITVTGTAGVVTYTLPAAITAPGSLLATTTIASTTTMTAGTGFTATTGNIVASTGNITASIGDLISTLGAVNAATTVTAGTGVTVTTGDITATDGDIVATLGHVKIVGAAKQLQVEGGTVTDFIGTATLASGTVTVSNTNIAAADRVFVSRNDLNGSTALGVFDVSIVASTSFTIDARKPADATVETDDASIVDYFIVRQL